MVIEQAKIIKRDVAEAFEVVRNHKHGLAGRLAIGATSTISPYLIPLMLKSFNKKYPKVELAVSELSTPGCLDHLEREKIDVAIMATEEDGRFFIQEKLYEEELLVFTDPSNELLKKGKIFVSDIAIDDIWLLEDGHCLSDEVIRLCKLRMDLPNLPGNLDFKIGSLESLRLLVQENSGYTLLPYLSTLKLNPKEKKCLRRFSGKQPKRSIFLTTSKGNLKEAAIKALKSEILLCSEKYIV